MPTYQYQCSNCGHELEEFQSMSEPPLTKCPNCGKETLLRIMGAGSGVIFKGSGFYLTDYRKSSSSPATNGEKKKGDSGNKEEKGKPASGKESAAPTPPAEKK